MTQHICGTCRHFEESEFAASGHCNHPARAHLRAMVLVRKTELGCRVDFETDLWEPREDLAAVSPNLDPLASIGRATVANDNVRNEYTDRVTSVSVATTAHIESETTRFSPSDDIRASSRQIQYEPDKPADRAGGAISAPVHPPLRSLAPELAERRDTGTTREREDHPGALHSRERTEPSRSEPPFMTDTSNRVVPRSTRTSPLRQDDDPLARSWGATRNWSDDRLRPTAPRVPLPSERPVEGLRRPMTAYPNEQVAPRPTNAIGPVSRQRPIEPPAAKSGEIPSARREREVELPQGRSGWTEPFTTTEAASRAVEMPAEAPEPAPTPSSNSTATSFVANPRLASIPTCCGTCRDFRPAEGGERGWCNNPYAFDHRRMVQRDELACKSTIGNWWIPSDDWWQQRADITHHMRPTPVVDDLLRELLESREARLDRRERRS